MRRARVQQISQFWTDRQSEIESFIYCITSTSVPPLTLPLQKRSRAGARGARTMKPSTAPSWAQWRNRPAAVAAFVEALPIRHSLITQFTTTPLSISSRTPGLPNLRVSRRPTPLHKPHFHIFAVNKDVAQSEDSKAVIKSDVARNAKRNRADRFKVQRRVAVGFAMGAVVIAFVFSGRWVFALGMTVTSLVGLYEYYRMVAAKGHLPAYKMGLCVTAATLLSSAIAPAVADVVFPVGGTMICIYLLFRRRRIATIADISTTFMGLFYAGYLPSFWVRLHEYSLGPTKNLIGSAVAKFWPAAFGFQPTITVGSLLIFWTWLSAASADIGAFFIGRTYGRTRFSNISPKKTVEGAVAGFVCSASVSVLGAYLLQWPIWWATGAVYGITVGILGLCGDLFESCFKRDVGWKDSGSLFPGHGGVLDRADSYILVGPLVYFFATIVLPFITKIVL